MESKTVKLKEETSIKITQIDNSIMFWSVQLGQLTMRLREVEAQISGLYDFKKSAILEDLKTQEIDVKDCDVSTINNNTVVIRPQQPQQPPDPFQMKASPGG
jgi:hypothetical protein